jgi:hypothetical protein
VERLAGIHEYGMELDTIGARILDGIRENRAHIFTHPDHKAEVEAQQKAAMEAANPQTYVEGVLQPCLAALDASGL